MDEVLNDPEVVCEKYHPDAKRIICWIPCWPFEGLMCTECGRVTVDWNNAKGFVWHLLIGWWWNGLIVVHFKGDGE